ncbi:MAG: hypothetical protein Fur006_28540 [Coleofasciculaceae cyanobacterium]
MTNCCSIFPNSFPCKEEMGVTQGESGKIKQWENISTLSKRLESNMDCLTVSPPDPSNSIELP